MVTLLSGGTVTADGTEQTVVNPTTSKYFNGYLDLTNMQSGDTTVVKLYVKISSSGSYVLYKTTTYSGAQSEPLRYFPPLPSDIGYKVTLQQTAGTNRAYVYRFYQV